MDACLARAAWHREGDETTAVTVRDERLDALSGLLLAGRYQLGPMRATGALCVVYDAQDVVLRRAVAIKVARLEEAQRYHEALNATAGLSYPAFVAIYDALEQDERFFLAQEFIDGQPLSAYVASGVPTRRGVALALQMARALAYTHRYDLAHGDVTPTAILIDRGAVAHLNNVRLPADWDYFDMMTEALVASGVAATADETKARLRDDERLRDVWAVGAALWSLVTEPARTQSSESGADVRAYREEVSPALQEMVARTLDLARKRRITAADELALELEALDEALASEAQQRRDTLPIAIRSYRANRAASALDRATGRRQAAGRADALANAPTHLGLTEQPTLDPAQTRPADDWVGSHSAPTPYDPYVQPAMAGRYDAYAAHGGQAAPERPRQAWPEPGPALRVGYDGAVSGVGVMRPWVWACIGVALFVAFFLIGYLIFPHFKMF